VPVRARPVRRHGGGRARAGATLTDRWGGADGPVGPATGRCGPAGRHGGPVGSACRVPAVPGDSGAV